MYRTHFPKISGWELDLFETDNLDIYMDILKVILGLVEENLFQNFIALVRRFIPDPHSLLFFASSCYCKNIFVCLKHQGHLMGTELMLGVPSEYASCRSWILNFVAGIVFHEQYLVSTPEKFLIPLNKIQSLSQDHYNLHLLPPCLIDYGVVRQ